jgi:hypothetical protein
MIYCFTRAQRLRGRGRSNRETRLGSVDRATLIEKRDTVL